ncbi:arylsulfatase A-like enzyme [Wenyingzhuangia heitensis]|uniref:Arylsulfatase A-like enzyme n=1 Tax=Wenyingzhuangia heitensis TaxID=1487859 RepID=A0ABX0U7M7_9FLAO|nr:arylsulfatase [Wenyingzhuangia heitensis]NIJ44850.1 arylsulfatase A-like enzyme [Wenyingzhuangia heitensis]
MKHFYKNIFTLLVLFLATTVTKLNAQKQPNVVVLMADDIGLGDLSFYQKERGEKKLTVHTPNIDKLIDQGMRFTDAHSPASLCAPTRFSMLTGNYSYRNQRPFGVWTPEANALIDANGFTTSARIAKKGGYTTAFFGKWGLGGSWVRKKGEKINHAYLNGGALSYGFDYALELPEGIQNIPFAFYENREWMKLASSSVLKELDANQTGYATSKKHLTRGGLGDSNWDPKEAGSILAHKAVDYINKQKKNQPFFMYYCSQAVHIPHEPPAKFDTIKVAGATPGKHGDMIYELDLQVGLLVEALKKTGAYENTLFIFTSDNGGLSFDKDMKKAGHDTSNGLSGSKGSINEGGHRVPFVAVWPGVIQPKSISNEPIVGQDVVATLAALSNQTLDKTKVLDSADLLPYFRGTAKEKAHTYLMHQSAGGPTFAIRDGDWKLILKSDIKKKVNKLGNLTHVALFNLKDNLSEDEAKNLINNSKYAKRIAEMKTTYIELRKTGRSTVVN